MLDYPWQFTSKISFIYSSSCSFFNRFFFSFFSVNSKEKFFKLKKVAYRCNPTLTSCPSVHFNNIGKVNDVYETKTQDIWIATSNGLFNLSPSSNNIVNITQVPGPLQAVSVEESTQTVVAGYYLLWRQINQGRTWHFFRTPGIIDDNVTSLVFDNNGTLWIGNDICFNLQHLDLTFQRIGHLDGLITRNITSLAAGSFDSIWAGSLQGAMRYYRGQWRYYYGPRWLPSINFQVGQSVVSVATMESHVDTGIIATDLGLSIIRWNVWTLEKKANYYQQMIYPRHDRFGLVSGVSLNKFGDLSTYFKRDDDNDGLWTSTYVAAQCFRYAVTKDPQAKKDGWRSFEAMEFLNNVTGIKGLMARSVLNQTTPPTSQWHLSTVYPGWVWKGDTSSDEVVGHMFVYPLVYDLLAETADEKARAYRLIDNIINYIIDNGYYLIDVTGKRTTWGVWAPEYLNDNPDWYDDRGVNSLQILSWILGAYRITQQPKLLRAYTELTEKYGYAINVINQKITQPSDDNYSDDELAFLPYYTYIHANPSLMQREFKLSIDRAHSIVKVEKPNLWNFIYGAYGGNFSLDDAISTLQTWPLSQIDWPVLNTKRLDVRINTDISREGHVQSVNLLPYDEINMFLWNGNPFEVDGGSGFGEYASSAWLLPYWIARYYKFIV